MPITPYTLEQAEEDISTLRGQVDQLTEILRMTDSTADWTNTVTGGAWLYSLAGHLKYLSSDANAYSTGHLISVLASDVPVPSTSPATVFTNNVNASTSYYVHGCVFGVNGASGTLQPQGIRFGGTCTVTSMLIRVLSIAEFANTSSPPMANGRITSLGTSISNPRTPALNELFQIQFEGIINVNAAGTLILQAREELSGSDVSWTAKANTLMVLEPV